MSDCDALQRSRGQEQRPRLENPCQHKHLGLYVHLSNVYQPFMLMLHTDYEIADNHPEGNGRVEQRRTLFADVCIRIPEVEAD